MKYKICLVLLIFTLSVNAMDKSLPSGVSQKSNNTSRPRRLTESDKKPGKPGPGTMRTLTKLVNESTNMVMKEVNKKFSESPPRVSMSPDDLRKMVRETVREESSEALKKESTENESFENDLKLLETLDKNRKKCKKAAHDQIEKKGLLVKKDKELNNAFYEYNQAVGAQIKLYRKIVDTCKESMKEKDINIAKLQKKHKKLIEKQNKTDSEKDEQEVKNLCHKIISTLLAQGEHNDKKLSVLETMLKELKQGIQKEEYQKEEEGSSEEPDKVE